VHINLHHKADECCCLLCGTYYRNKVTLSAHRRNVHMHKVRCSQCGYEANSKSTLYSHTLSHHPAPGATRHQCPSCERSYNAKRILHEHIRDTHLRFGCDVGVCIVRFESEANRLHHRATEHNINIPVFGNARIRLCDECQEPFRTMKQYRDHHLRAHVNLVID